MDVDWPVTGRHGRILVVEHEANAGVGLVGERILAAGLHTHTVGPAVGATVPVTARGYDAVVVLGGTPGPTDDDDAAWLPRVRELVADCLAREVPYLGVCLGAQILAVVAGGVVGDVRNGPEIGLVDLTVTDAGRTDPLLGDVPAGARAMQWHFLEVHDLPPGSTSLCRSDRCETQAFRVGPRAWGLQFHLEVLADTARAWARDDREDLHELGLDATEVVDEVRAAEADLRSWWSATTDRWIDVVTEHAGRA